tara:strand:- start:2967 stop:3626 length:660 start_codon:yes stop_codon:yes gene_type:complete
MSERIKSYFKSSFHSAEDEYNGKGIRPVVFDIIGPDHQMSLLPDDLKLVLHVNPSTMSISQSKVIERIQTLGGFVEQHWGDAPTELSFEMATGGFMRLYTGLTATTGPSPANERVKPKSMQAWDINGTRRETIAYDKYLDLLALFHNNGMIYDRRGTIAMQGQIKVSFDGMSWFGYFSSFSVSEAAEQPFSFSLSASFTCQREEHSFQTMRARSGNFVG